MSDTCAQYYNFDGKNNAKNPFKELTLNSIIIDVVLNFHTDATEYDVKTKIRNWLRLASTRISNKIIHQTLKQKISKLQFNHSHNIIVIIIFLLLFSKCSNFHLTTAEINIATADKIHLTTKMYIIYS